MVQGLGPGLTTVAMRRSVICRVEGLELVFTFLIGVSWSALALWPSSAPASTVADDLKSPLRPILPAF